MFSFFLSQTRISRRDHSGHKLALRIQIDSIWVFLFEYNLPKLTKHVEIIYSWIDHYPIIGSLFLRDTLFNSDWKKSQSVDDKSGSQG